MPPKQATLGKFFGNPNGSTPKPQQSTLAFQKPKVKAAPSDHDGEVATITETEDKQSEVVKKEGVDGDVTMTDKSNVEGSHVNSEEEPPSQEIKEDLEQDGSKTQSKSRRTSKRSNREVKEEATEDDDDEPVRKRLRRGAFKEKPKRPKNPSTHADEQDANIKGAASEEPQKPKRSPKKKQASKSPEVDLSKDDDTSKAADKIKKKKSKVEAAAVSDGDGEVAEKVSSEVEAEDTDPEEQAEILSKFKSKENDPYPDWKPGEPVPYAAICTTFSLIEMTTKRLVITAHCSQFLRQVMRLTPQDLLPTVQLMINKLAADYAGVELGIGESLIMKAIGESTGRSLQIIKADQKDIGDLGLVAAKSRSNQPTMFKPKPLTVRGVLEGLMGIATTSGDGSQARKVAGIKKLLSSADVAMAGKGSKGIDISKNKGGASESKFIIRFLEGKLRLGLAEKTVLVSLANAVVTHEISKKSNKVPSAEKLAEGQSILKTVFSELPSYEVIVPAMVEHGIFHLRENCKLQPGVPLKPMLAKPTKSITEVLDRFEGKNFTCEYKYDGERAQIHYVAEDSPKQYASSVPASNKGGKGLSAIFSRNSEDLSKKYPDILAKLNTWIKPETKSFVLDCETVAWDLKEKKVLPFQQLMTRKRKDVKTEDITVKVCVFAFDMLFYNGEAIVEKSLRERRTLLNEAFSEVEGEFSFAQFGNTDNLEEIQILLDESVKASCEGLMVKMLDTGESGYEPSKRSRNWLKVKKDYLFGIGDSLDLVVLGAYHGKGKRTSVYGAFLLACYNPSKERYETVCNIGTGFSEAILEELHTKLKDHTIDGPKPFYSHSKVPKDQPDVWFEPRFVWEVKTADLTLSPRYKAGADDMADKESGGKGISLRFPRFIKERDDKKADQATDSKMVVEMYHKQEGVGKSKGPSVDDDFEY